MADNRFFEEVEIEEFEEAMADFEDWRREIEVMLWEDIQNDEWGF